MRLIMKMSNRRRLAIVFGLSISLALPLLGVFGGGNVLAANKYIQSVKTLKADGCGDHTNALGTTLFNVTFNWGNLCRRGFTANGAVICKDIEAEGKGNDYHCVTPGAKCPTASNVKSVSVSGPVKQRRTEFSTEKWEFFDVDISVSDGYQNIEGQIRRLKIKTATVNAVDIDTKSIIQSNISSASDYYGYAVTVYANYKNSGYSFVGWEPNKCASVTTSACTTPGLASNITINAYYKKQYTLTGVSKSTVCSNNDCESLAGVSGLETVSKTVSVGQDASVTRGLTENGYTYLGLETSLDGSYMNHPEATYKQTMNSNATVYFIYEPFKGESTLDLAVKNNSVDAYSDRWYNGSEEVYAKPGDELSYKMNYVPNAQAGMGIKPQKVKIDSGNADTNSGNLTVKGYFNKYAGAGYGEWSNGVTLSGARGGLYTYEDGKTDAKEEIIPADSDSPIKVGKESVGSEIREEASLYNNTSLTTPKSVKIGLDSSQSLATVLTGLSSETLVKVPYNFITSSEMKSLGGEKPATEVSAGNEITYNGIIDLYPKVNTLTMNPGDEDYVTLARDVKVKLVVYNQNEDEERPGGILNGKDSDICLEFFGYDESNCSYSSELTKDISPDNENSKSVEGTFVVGDKYAGEEICVALAVFPATSGADSNWNDLNYDNTWRISSSDCYRVAKKPSLQVWGGSIYSDANIDLPLSYKRHLANYVNYDASMTDADPYVFGSWGELGLITNKPVKGFASGASIGYLQNDNEGNTWPRHNAINDNSINDGPGGYRNDTSSDDVGVLCALSPLTIANENCDTGTVGNLGTDTSVGGINKDHNTLEALADALAIGGTNDVSGVLSTFQGESNHYEATGALTIGQSEDITVPSNRTILVHSKDNIQINKNIVYENIDYQSLLQIPKLIIYSDETINIDCTVTRIDAVLLAKTVDTCPTENINSRQNSNQLFIYGAVIANNLKANRTYGAAPGNNSVVPAEIIDFDPTLYLWQGANDKEDSQGNPEDEKDNRGLKTDIVYIQEIVPRY